MRTFGQPLSWGTDVLVQRSEPAPGHDGLPWDERWGTLERSLLTCWEVGRALATERPADASKARLGVLVGLPWKGGDNAKNRVRWAPLQYLAAWQGLRGESLAIDTAAVVVVRCSETSARVKFTAHAARWSTA